MNTQKPTLPPTPTSTPVTPPSLPFVKTHRGYIDNQTIRANLRTTLDAAAPVSEEVAQVLLVVAKANAEGRCAMLADLGDGAQLSIYGAWLADMLQWVDAAGDRKGLNPAYYLTTLGILWAMDRGVEALPPAPMPPPTMPPPTPIPDTTGRQLCLFGGEP